MCFCGAEPVTVGCIPRHGTWSDVKRNVNIFGLNKANRIVFSTVKTRRSHGIYQEKTKKRTKIIQLLEF